MYTIQYTVDSIQCTLYSVQYTVYTIQCEGDPPGFLGLHVSLHACLHSQPLDCTVHTDVHTIESTVQCTQSENLLWKCIHSVKPAVQPVIYIMYTLHSELCFNCPGITAIIRSQCRQVVWLCFATSCVLPGSHCKSPHLHLHNTSHFPPCVTVRPGIRQFCQYGY